MAPGAPGQAAGVRLGSGRGRRPSQWALCLAGCAGKQVAHRYARRAPALGQAPERRPGGGSVPPAPESPAAATAAAAARGSTGGRQLPDRWAGAGDAALGFRPGELGLASRLVLGVLGMDRPHLAAKKRDEVLPGRSPANPGPREKLAFGSGAGFLAGCLPARPGLCRALSGAPRPCPPPSAPDYLGWAKPAGPGLAHGAPGEERQPGQCPRGTAHCGGWRGPQ